MERSVGMMRLRPTSMILLELAVVVILAAIIELAASVELAGEEYPRVGRRILEASTRGASSSPWDLTKTASRYAPENPDLIYERTITELRVTKDVVYNREGNSEKKLIPPIWEGLKNFNKLETHTDGTESKYDNSVDINRDTESVENSEVEGNNERKFSSKFIDSMDNRISELETEPRKDDGDDRIVFMDSDEIKTIPRNVFAPDAIDNECDGSTLCKKMKTYPTNYIETIIKNMSNLIPFSGIDEVNKIEQRFQDTEGDTALCQSEESTYFFEGVRKDLNDPDSWHLVVNVKDFLQGIRVNKCLNSTRGCTVLDRLRDSDLPNYNTFCKQQYIHHRLVVISRENGTPIVESFPIPSGCCCHIIFETESRFGGNEDPATNSSSTNNNNNNNNDDEENNDNNNYRNHDNNNNNNTVNDDSSMIKRMKKWRTRMNKGGRWKNNKKL